VPQLNQLIKYFLIISIFILTSCGDHSKPIVIDGSGTTPIINLTSGPYAVIVGQEVTIGVETQFGVSEPIYTAIPSPTGIAQVNKLPTGQIVIKGQKAGSTTFTITDQANPTAVPRTIEVTVKDPPKLEVTPDPIDGIIGQSILLEITTLNPENDAKFTLLINDTSVANILDAANNPNLIELLKIGITKVTIEDVNNNLTKEVTITVK